jgi:hypothetical protein
MNIQPPFHEYHFIDTDPERANQLRELAGNRTDAHTYTEDCNTVSLRDVFPRAKRSCLPRELGEAIIRHANDELAIERPAQIIIASRNANTKARSTEALIAAAISAFIPTGTANAASLISLAFRS